MSAPSATLAPVSDRTAEMKRLLAESISFRSLSGHEAQFVHHVRDWAAAAGFKTDLWIADEAQVARAGPVPSRHLPLAGRPTLVVRLPGRGQGRSLMFNAHSDVVAAPHEESWTAGAGPWSGREIGGTIYGRGACDVKGPMVAALWAMTLLRDHYPDGLAGDVLLELVPGEEDCVGLGTLTSVARGHRADAAIVLEPTENLPRCASRGGLRFDVTARGRAVHGTVKWLGKDAIRSMQSVLRAIAQLETRWNDRSADPLFASYPLARPMTVDTIAGGEWQGMVCDRCTCGGYLELLPRDDRGAAKARFQRELREELERTGESPADVDVSFGEEYDGHRLDPTHALCRTAEAAVAGFEALTSWSGWSGFNSGCEAGLRANLLGTPTLVWGPGTLARAHAADESIEFGDVARAARMFADVAARWSNTTKDNG